MSFWYFLSSASDSGFEGFVVAPKLLSQVLRSSLLFQQFAGYRLNFELTKVSLLSVFSDFRFRNESSFRLTFPGLPSQFTLAIFASTLMTRIALTCQDGL